MIYKLSVLAAAAAATAAATAQSDDYVLVPGAGKMHRSCVHSIRGGVLDAAELIPCAYPTLGQTTSNSGNLTHGAAWKAWAQTTSGTGSVTSLVSQWVVPGEPSASGGQTLFFWNGMEPSDTSAVLQPVLQWGTSAAGGGNYWAYASWYVSGSHGSYFSPVVRVETGVTMTGNNTLASNGSWIIASTAPGHAPSTLVFKPVPGNWAIAYHVLEAYGVTTVCNLYPKAGAVNFTAVVAAFDGKPVAPLAWSFQTQTAGCGEHASASKAGDSVQIAFNTA